MSANIHDQYPIFVGLIRTAKGWVPLRVTAKGTVVQS